MRRMPIGVGFPAGLFIIIHTQFWLPGCSDVPYGIRHITNYSPNGRSAAWNPMVFREAALPFIVRQSASSS